MASNGRTLKEWATFDIMGSAASKIVNEVVVADNQRLENKITKLTSLVRQLAIGQNHNSPPVRVCDICASIIDIPTTTSIHTTTTYAIEFLGGFGQADGHE
ncbi:hypothetical protein CR513_10759, partial [Mucuna pruriens]